MLIAAIMYDSTNLPNFLRKGYPLLIKLDGDGNVRWLKKFEEDTSGTFSDLLISGAFELPNGDIIYLTALNASPVSSVYTTIVFRLTRDGNIIWKNSLRNMLGIFGSPPGTFTWRIESAAEGLNGDVILCGTSQSGLSSGIIETVVRVNKLGQLVWDANYGNHGIDGSYRFGAEGISAFVQNGQIVLVGLSLGTNNPRTAPAVNFLTLDYKNGNLLAKRFFRPDYTDKIVEKSFSYSATHFTRLFNGNFLFYGKLFGDLMSTDSIIDHFGVIEFDPAFNLVDSYTISSSLKTNFYNDQLFFDAAGKGLVSVFEYLNNYDSNVFFGAFNNRQFQNQRKAHYINAGLPGFNGFAFVKDSGYAFIQSYFENQPAIKSYFEFRKMHNSDTSSQCLGKDTMLLNFLPLHIIEDSAYYLLDDNDPDKIVASDNNISQTDTTSTSSLSPCKQTNYCDTINIQGNPVICGNAPSIMFTAYKNPECGSIVQWTIDESAIDSLKVLNGSSARIWFKNINWQGNLYASLAAGMCDLPAIDTLPVTVVRLQSPINLGPDTVLCNQNSIVLHAGNNFSSYLWQNGSKDSVLTVVTPGIYWVRASGFCGNNFSDSITIKPFNASIFIGPDRTKCNNDTLHLSAPSNFLNYTWSNNYNINSTTSKNVIVDPITDTAYYIKAEAKPGCFVYDTVKVQVKTSPLINLGIDKSFCQGDSALFNAGSGFEYYFWNDGSTTQQNIIKSAGTYSVIGTTADGCKSYDTVKVLNVFLPPVVSLDHNNSLCTGATGFLDAGDFSSYLWNNGSTSRKSAVNGIGVYAV